MVIIYMREPVTDANIMQKDFSDASDVVLFCEDNQIPYTIEFADL